MDERARNLWRLLLGVAQAAQAAQAAEAAEAAEATQVPADGGDQIVPTADSMGHPVTGDDPRGVCVPKSPAQEADAVDSNHANAADDDRCAVVPVWTPSLSP